MMLLLKSPQLENRHTEKHLSSSNDWPIHFLLLNFAPHAPRIKAFSPFLLSDEKHRGFYSEWRS